MDMWQIQLKMIYHRIRIIYNIIFVKRYRNEKVSLFNSDYIIKKYNIFQMNILWTGCGYGFPASGDCKG